MLLKDYMQAIVNDLRQNATFLKDVNTHGRILGARELGRLALKTPACRIAMIGTRGGSQSQSKARSRIIDTMGRADIGMFRGPLLMVAFLIARDERINGQHVEARDRVIDIADQFMTFIEQRTFGLQANEAGPVMVVGFEILYQADIEDQGIAVAAVGFEQEVWFGRNLHLEDPAWPLIGDSPQLTEQDWQNVGLTPDGQVLVKGEAEIWPDEAPGQPSPDTEEHEPIHVEGDE